MIPNITRGRRVQGLLRYLYGPGRREEHTNPHLVAAWDGAGELATLEPAVTSAGRRDFRPLVELLEIPLRAGRNSPRQPVWHCSVRAHPTDRPLTDQQWAHIAGEVVAAVGLAPHADDRAVRWVAVRHAEDHIHIVATLVRQDRRAVWPRYDYPKAQAACRDIETHYGLYRVATPGQSARAWPTRAESNKAARHGRAVTPRERLRRTVRDIATIAVDETDFVTRLQAAGVLVQPRVSERDPGVVTGYSVGLPSDTTATGTQLYYGGAKLAADLSLPRLRQRWGEDTTVAGSDRRAHQLRPPPAEIYQQAATFVTSATAGMADDPGAAGRTAQAAADLLTATAAVWEGHAGGPLTRAAELLDRATHERTPAPARRGSTGFALRSLARIVHATGSPGEHRHQQDIEALLRLIRALAGLADAIAELRAAQQRLHQADTARAAAQALRGYQPPETDAPPFMLPPQPAPTPLLLRHRRHR